MGNDVWKGGGTLNPNEQVGDVLRSGTLGIGFIGGHNAMVALYGEGHGHSQKAWDTLYEAVTEMNKIADEYKAKYNLNYSVLATPAEGLSGRFTKMDRRKFGKIPGVTDRDYYVNSFHVDVKEPISIVEKSNAKLLSTLLPVADTSHMWNWTEKHRKMYVPLPK
jgi:NrdD: anaerobic ribonucleoside-triphosphate reductase